jgi:probable rRNA maturation factor
MRRVTATLLQDLLGLEAFMLEINVVTAAEITRLNESFLRHKGSTDVITFDYAPEAPSRAPRESRARSIHQPRSIHGEVFVCIHEAIRQSSKFHVALGWELVRYIVHGVLHLLGFDDSQPARRRVMKRQEDRFLGKLANRFDLRSLTARPGKATL